MQVENDLMTKLKAKKAARRQNIKTNKQNSSETLSEECIVKKDNSPC